MKESMAKNGFDLLSKIEIIEKDVRALKLTILKKLSPSAKKIVKLKGILKGIEFTEWLKL